VAVPEAFGFAAGALHQARFMLGGLIVDTGRMAKNLAMTHGLIVAEAVMMGLAPHTGRNEAHDLVYDACRAAIETDRPLLGGTGDHFPLLGERLSHPVYHRTHARGAAQIRMNDDPVFGSEFGDPRGQPLEQRMPVADIARQRAAAGTGADRFQMHEHR
jgi:hypothetical protein